MTEADTLKSEVTRLYALCTEYSKSLSELVNERDRYKWALERIVKSTSGTFRDIARRALHIE